MDYTLTALGFIWFGFMAVLAFIKEDRRELLLVGVWSLLAVGILGQLINWLFFT